MAKLLDDKGRLFLRRLNVNGKGLAKLFYGNILEVESTKELLSLDEWQYKEILDAWKKKSNVDDIDKYIEECKGLDTPKTEVKPVSPPKMTTNKFFQDDENFKPTPEVKKEETAVEKKADDVKTTPTLEEILKAARGEDIENERPLDNPIKEDAPTKQSFNTEKPKIDFSEPKETVEPPKEVEIKKPISDPEPEPKDTIGKPEVKEEVVKEKDVAEKKDIPAPTNDKNEPQDITEHRQKETHVDIPPKKEAETKVLPNIASSFVKSEKAGKDEDFDDYYEFEQKEKAPKRSGIKVKSNNFDDIEDDDLVSMTYEQLMALTQANNKKNNMIIPFIIGMVITVILLLGLYIATPLGMNLIGGGNNPDSQVEATTDVTVLKAVKDIHNGDIITEDMLGEIVLSATEYNNLNNTTIVAANGSTSNSALVTAENIRRVTGKYATRDIKAGEYITISDFSNQKIIAEKTFIEVEIDGETVSIPIDNIIGGDTSVKIVAIITSDNAEGSTAISLAEFMLKDRTLEDIFNSSGRSILQQLAQAQAGTNSAE